MTVVRVGMFFPAGEGQRYTAQSAAGLIGKMATIENPIFKATGIVVEARVVDDPILRHGLFITVEETLANPA